jgi:5-methylcytosine-specific restriction endonuclease McrA
MRSSSEQAKARRACFHTHKQVDEAGHVYMVCHLCGGKINPAVEGWDASHVIRHSLTKNNDPTNVMPAHRKCHRVTVPDDTKAAAKDVRVSEKHYGIKRKRGFGNQWRSGT